jgi:ERCC4-type nuclease
MATLVWYKYLVVPSGTEMAPAVEHVTVTVDSRPGETPLFDALVLLLADVPCVTVARALLDIGDIRVATEQQTILIERKTWSDLCASLMDSRYTNQKARLLAERERRAADPSSGSFTFAYLMEGVPPNHDGMTRNCRNASAYAALSKMAIRDCIASLWARDARDAVQCVAYIALTASKRGFDAGEKLQKHAAGGYASFVKHTGKRKNAEDDLFVVMLSSIPGVSARVATAVAAAHPSAAALVRAYDAARAEGADVKKLQNLLIDVDTGGGKRLGPALSGKLYGIFGTAGA